MADTSLLEQEPGSAGSIQGECLAPGAKRATPRALLTYVEHGNSDRVWRYSASKRVVRRAQPPSGHRKTQEANAGTPKGKRKAQV